MAKRARDSRVCGARKANMTCGSYPQGEALSLGVLEQVGQGFTLESEMQHRSRTTLEIRRRTQERLLAFCRDQGAEVCGRQEALAFLAGINTGRRMRGGAVQPVRPRTVQMYFVELRALFDFAVKDGALDKNPLAGVDPPRVRQDQIQPFTDEQIDALLKAAERTQAPKRDKAIRLFLLDTGCRVSELCDLRLSDLDMQTKTCQVLGKGNKRRALYFQATTARALWSYLREQPHAPSDPLFMAARGIKGRGAGLTRTGVFLLMTRLGKAAGIVGVRVSPHTFRHSMAVRFLRNGDHVFALQRLLGHTSLATVNRYLAFAQADLEEQHRLCSPVEGLNGGGRGGARR